MFIYKGKKKNLEWTPKIKLDPNSLWCTKILLHHPFLSFLPHLFLPCKDTFTDDYDGIYNCNGLKYTPFEIFDSLFFMGIKI
jgi:hypothetical protein